MVKFLLQLPPAKNIPLQAQYKRKMSLETVLGVQSHTKLAKQISLLGFLVYREEKVEACADREN